METLSELLPFLIPVILLQIALMVVALVDLLAGLAEVAAAHDYVRPLVHDGDELSIVAGRHPVVERSLIDKRFVPNDTELTARGRALAVLTGPNMGGKSTYLRQVAQIVLLCLPSAPNWAWWTGSSAAWAPRTAWPRARARSWWR